MRTKTAILLLALVLVLTIPTQVQADTHYYAKETSWYSFSVQLGNNTEVNRSIMTSPPLEILPGLDDYVYEYDWSLELVAIELIMVNILIEPNNLTTLLTISRGHSLYYMAYCQDLFMDRVDILEIVYHGNLDYPSLKEEFNITLNSESEIDHTIIVAIGVLWAETYYGEDVAKAGYNPNPIAEPRELEPFEILAIIIVVIIVFIRITFKEKSKDPQEEVSHSD